MVRRGNGSNGTGEAVPTDDERLGDDRHEPEKAQDNADDSDGPSSDEVRRTDGHTEVGGQEPDTERVASRAAALRAEERRAGSDDPLMQAKEILAAAEQRRRRSAAHSDPDTPTD